jgi:hypothetical protein
MNIQIQLIQGAWAEKDPFDTWQPAWFKVNIFKTRELLEFELKKIDARNVVLYTMHSPEALRRDGWVRADKAPRGPGVILEFEKPIAGTAHWEEMRFPCRAFEKWEDNVRAIALALEALRKIDRYGVTTGAQYAGYKALPPAEPGTQGQTPAQAAEFIAGVSSWNMPNMAEALLNNLEFAEMVYKAAAKKLHPDKGGDATEFAKLEGSMRLVRESFGQAQSAGG